METQLQLVNKVLGKGIGLAKDKLRGALFGGGQSIGEALLGEKRETEYTNSNPYTKVLKEERDYKSEGGYKTLEEYEEETPIKFGKKVLNKLI